MTLPLDSPSPDFSHTKECLFELGSQPLSPDLGETEVYTEVLPPTHARTHARITSAQPAASCLSSAEVGGRDEVSYSSHVALEGTKWAWLWWS